MEQPYSDEEDYGGRVIYGEEEEDIEAQGYQSQDDIDAGNALHTKFNVAARKRIGLSRKRHGRAGSEANSMLAGSEEIERRLQQRSPQDIQQTLRGILQQVVEEGDAYQDPEASPGPTPLEDSPHGWNSPLPAAPSPLRSPGIQLTAASQAPGQQRTARPARGPAATAAGYGGEGVIVAGDIEVDEELIAFSRAMPASKRQQGTTHRGRNYQGRRTPTRPARPAAAAPPPAAPIGATPLATAKAANPLLNLLNSAAGTGPRGRHSARQQFNIGNAAQITPVNGASAAGGGGGGGSATAAQLFNSQMPPQRGYSRFRQPALGTPGGAGLSSAGGVGGMPAPRTVIRNQSRFAAGAAAAAPPQPAAAFAPAAEEPQAPAEEINSSEEDEGDMGGLTPQAARPAAPDAAAVAAAGAPTPAAQYGAFLASVAPSSARGGAASAHRRRTGAGGFGVGYSGRLKRVKAADSDIAAAASYESSSGTQPMLLATVKAHETEGSVTKFRGLFDNKEEACFLVAAERKPGFNLRAGCKIKVRQPWRELRDPENPNEKVYLCCGGVVEVND